MDPATPSNGIPRTVSFLRKVGARKRLGRPDRRLDRARFGATSIGYLSRHDAEDYQDVLIAVEQGGAQVVPCSAFLRRADNGNWGVVLALSSPRRTAAGVRRARRAETSN